MAITRAQQAKQMLQDGGRIGFRIGSGDKDSKGRSYDTSGENMIHHQDPLVALIEENKLVLLELKEKMLLQQHK